MGDQFKPVIVAYGSVSNSKNKAQKLVPLSKRSCKSPVIPGLSSEKKDKLKQLSIVQTINLASSPDRKSTKQLPEEANDEVIALSPLPQSTSGFRSTKVNKGVSTTVSTSVVNLDDDVITLSPDLVPFSIPEHSDLSQQSQTVSSNKVLAVVTLEESSPPAVHPLSNRSVTTDPSVSNASVATDPPILNTPIEDPLQIVITLPESPDLITLEDSPPGVMETAVGNVHELMEQINALIVKNESSEKNQSKAIAKVTSRLGNADPVYVQSEEFAILLTNAIQEIKKNGAELYVQLKIILEKLKSSTQAPANVAENSTTTTDSTATSAPTPSTSARKHINPTRVEIPKLSQSPITLDTSSLKRYDKANYVKALEWFEQLVSIIEEVEPDKALCDGIVTKLRTRLDKAEKKYLYSILFLDTLKFTINGILSDPGKIYGFIRQTVDELKANMKCPDTVQPQPSTSKTKDNTDNESNKSDNEDSNSNPLTKTKSQPVEDAVDLDEGLDDKTRAHIRKLEKTLKKLEKVIKKLDQEECWGSEDEEEDEEGANSAYIKLDRYMERYMKIFNKICELRGRKADLGRSLHSKVRFDCTEYMAINRTIERFYNKTHQFPDYGDMLGLVQKVSETNNLCLSSAAMQHIAEKAFTSLGEILKQRRMEDDYDVFITRLGTAEDPAIHDTELAKKLEENKKHWGKIDEVINKYVIIQEEKKKKRDENEEEKEDEEDEDEDDEEDKEKDNDSELDKDGDDSESENEKENNTAESNDEAKSDSENKRRKLQERRRSDNENTTDKNKQKEDDGNDSDTSNQRFSTCKQYNNWTQRKINSVLEEHNIQQCRVVLDDCVELYHNSPDKEESFFKYLNLAKKTKYEDEDDDKMEENESETRETEENSETKQKEMGSKENNGSDSTERDDKNNRDLKHAKRKLLTEYGESSRTREKTVDTVKTKVDTSDTIKIKTEVEDQDEIVTSTTQEMEDEADRFESNEENNLKSATCDSLNDVSGDSTICVTSSMHGSEELMDTEEIEHNNEGNVETEKIEKTEVKEANVKVEPKDQCDTEVNEERTHGSLVTEDSMMKDDSTVIVEDQEQTWESSNIESNSKEVTDESDTICNNKTTIPTDSIEDFTTLEDETNFLPNLEDFINKDKLKVLLDSNENVDEIYTHLEHCQVEVNAVDLIENCQIELTPVDISDDNGSKDEEYSDHNSDNDEKLKETSKKRKNRVSSSEENGSQSDIDCNSRRIRKRQKQVKYKEESGGSDQDDVDKDSNFNRTIRKRQKQVKYNEDSDQEDIDDDSSHRIRKREKKIKYKEESEESDNEDRDEKTKKSKQETDSESDDDEACGLPVKKIAKSKPRSGTTTSESKQKSKPSSKSQQRKRRKSTISEEEEEEVEDVSAKSDDSSDEDFNPYEEAKAIRDMRDSKRSSSRKRRRTGPGPRSKGQRQWSSPQLATNVNYNPVAGGGVQQSYNYQPRGRSPMGPAGRTMGPASQMMGPGSKTMGPASRTMGPQANRVGPQANRTMGPASHTMGPQANRMGPASRTVGPQANRTMGPASRMNLNQAGGAYQYGGVTITPKVPQPQVNPLLNLKNVTITRKNEMPSSSSQGFQPRSNMGPRGFQRPPYGPASATNRTNIGLGSGNPNVPRGPSPRTISQQNSNKTLIKGGVQFQRNTLQASQTGGVNTMRKESHINSRQRLGGALHEQKIHMKHTVNQDTSSGAGQDTRVTSNIQKTVTQDGRQVIRKVKKIVTTNIEVEEIEIGAGEVINLD